MKSSVQMPPEKLEKKSFLDVQITHRNIPLEFSFQNSCPVSWITFWDFETMKFLESAQQIDLKSSNFACEIN